MRTHQHICNLVTLSSVAQLHPHMRNTSFAFSQFWVIVYHISFSHYLFPSTLFLSSFYFIPKYITYFNLINYLFNSLHYKKIQTPKYTMHNLIYYKSHLHFFTYKSYSYEKNIIRPFPIVNIVLHFLIIKNFCTPKPIPLCITIQFLHTA